MISNFKSILEKHENDDKSQINLEQKFINDILEEYENGKEIIEYAFKHNYSLNDFICSNLVNFPITPIRQSDKFYIKKHTFSQIPYYHNHNFYEIIYVHKGSITQKFKDFNDITLTEKQCLILSPNTIHLIEKNKEHDVIFKIVIPKQIFEKTGKLIIEDFDYNNIKIFNNINETAEFFILNLLNEQSRDSKHKSLIIQNYLTLLFIEITKEFTSSLTMENLLNEYFKNNIDSACLSDFATLQNYNTNYISRLIKKQTGKNFSELYSNYRMLYATNLLLENNMSIEEIASKIGYSTVSGFYKQFYNVYGMLPAEYRKLNK